MMGHTHALFGVAALTVVEAAAREMTATGLAQPHPVKGLPVGTALCLGAAIVGALLPDLDAEQSSLQSELGLGGRLIRGTLALLGVKHRGVLHSGLAVLVVSLMAVGLGRWLGYIDVGLAFALGYFSHVCLADAMTLSGVSLFWPQPGRFHLLPPGLRVRTGGPAEGLVFLLVLLLILALLWLRPDMIPAELFRWPAPSLPV